MNVYQRDEPVYDVALVCINGHTINSTSLDSPERNAQYCKHCGEKTINACPGCNVEIRGYLHNTGVHGIPWYPPAHCHACGKAFPWTERKVAALAEAIDEADELSADDKAKLKESIPDLVVETPKSNTAAARLKSAISKAGKTGGKLIYDVAIKVAADVVTKSISP
jgi:hypothetical protein